MKKLILDIDHDLWEKFKQTVPRMKNLNEAVVDLVRREVEENG